MQYDIEESGLSVTMTAANFDVAVAASAPLAVDIGECAKIDVGEAVNYIESGKAEIGAAVDIGVNRIASSVTEGISDFNLNALNKTNAFNQNAGDKTYAFDNNASDKTTAFNNNATSKTGDFNTNATNKTTAFNDNAAIKQAAVDASAAEAKQWAIGEPTEPAGYSAKYWADNAASATAGLNERVTAIESEIPAQASSSNQLADKNFVNSSIATNTANFIGTFNSVAELEAYSGQKDDNDYAFVVSTDAAGNTVYNRYKWNGTAWLFEYALNNSSFTANQWAAINSGATTANIGQIATKADDSSVVHLTGNETIAGVKTFSSDMITDDIYPKGYITLGTSTNTWGKMIQFQDTTGKRIARIQPMAVTTTINRVGMWVNNADNTTEKGIYVDSDGTTSAPTPSAGDNSTKIATTAFVGKAVSNTLSTLYPVGSIYIGTQSTCPLATLISGSTWVKVSEGRVLQGSDSNHNAGTTIEAGLPNLSLYTPQSTIKYGSQPNTVYNVNGTSGNTNNIIGTNQPAKLYIKDDNNIVGNSNTVQPPAYVVNIWQRTA